MVSEKAEKDKRINLKPGRYVRIESDTRLARVDGCCYAKGISESFRV